MVRINTKSAISLGLLLPTTLALPQFWPHGYKEKPYPTLTVSSSDGVYPTGVPGSTGTGTGTGTGTAYYPTATGSAYVFKRDSVHQFGYPPPYRPSVSSGVVLTGMPTASAPPVLSTYIPTGTAPSASGTGTRLAYPTYVPNKREINEAKQAHRQHFEGPRKRDLKPYYPYVPDHSSYYTAGPSATGSGGIPMPTGTTPVPLPMPTGTIVIPPPMPTGGTGSVGLPTPSGTAWSSYSTMTI